MYYVIIYTVPPQFDIIIEQHTEKYVTLRTDCLTRLMRNCTKSLHSKQYNKKNSNEYFRNYSCQFPYTNV